MPASRRPFAGACAGRGGIIPAAGDPRSLRTDMPPIPTPPGRQRQQRRAFWMKQLHQWHWISSALCLVGMLLFAFTGITLNHAGSIEAKPAVRHESASLPPPLRKLVAGDAASKAALPEAVAGWVGERWQARVAGRPAEWSADEIYLSLPRPGGDGWLSIDRETGAVEYEVTRRGAVAWLNDLHKGRHAGTAWSWFLDIFALACFVFALTGLCLLKIHAARRASTWPLVAAGLAVPLLLALFFIHA